MRDLGTENVMQIQNASESDRAILASIKIKLDAIKARLHAIATKESVRREMIMFAGSAMGLVVAILLIAAGPLRP